MISKECIANGLLAVLMLVLSVCFWFLRQPLICGIAICLCVRFTSECAAKLEKETDENREEE